jgi:phage-related protein
LEEYGKTARPLNGAFMVPSKPNRDEPARFPELTGPLPFSLFGYSSYAAVLALLDSAERGSRLAEWLKVEIAGRSVNVFVNIPKMDWEIAYYSDDVQAAILGLPVGIQARFVHLTERMVTFGPDLGMPHTRAMGKGLFELRMKSKEGICRVFFCTLPGRRIIMLHAVVKKSQKTPAKELKIARTQQKEVQADADA